MTIPQGFGPRRSYADAYRQQLANQLIAQGGDTSPIQSGWQGAARLAQALMGGYLTQRNEQRENDQQRAFSQGLQEAMAPRMVPSAAGDGPRVGATMAPPSFGDVAQRLGANPATAHLAPQFQIMGMQQDAQSANERAKTERDLTARREDRQAQNDFLASQAREGMAFRAQESEAARQQAAQLADLQRRTSLEAAQLRAGNRVDPLTLVADPNDPTRGIYVPQSQAAGQQAPRAQQRAENLPSAALKLQNEAVEQIGLTAAINADLSAFGRLMDEGKLTFGPVENLMNRARNAAGRSTEQSANFASFQSSLEKLRNDSLRLNSGVQTEGDAQRAWNELFQNINDPRLVRQRLAEIQRINERAGLLKQNQVDMMRANYGLPPLDTSSFRGVPAAIGGGAPNTTQGQGGVSEGATATNPQTGQRITYRNGQWVPAQ